MKPYLCIGVPYFLGEVVAGRNEVTQIRQSGIVEELGADWISLQPDANIHDPIIAVNRALAQVIAQHPDQTPLVFGSDCVLALGIMKGLGTQQPDVLWYDAHGDFNTPQTSLSGFAGGMPLAALVGRGNKQWLSGIELAPLPERAVTLTDARNLDPEEKKALASSQVNKFDHVTQNWRNRRLYLHLDLDVVDAAEMPAHPFPEPNGPSLATVAQTLTHVRTQADIAAILVDLWDDRLPHNQVALQQTLHLIRAITG